MLRRLRWKTLTFIIVIVGLAFASLVPQTVDLDVPGIRLERGTDDILGLSLGLDLAGGTQLVYQAGDASFAPSEEQMEGLVASISRRVDRLGVSEPSIQTLGSDRLLIQLPGVEDVAQARGEEPDSQAQPSRTVTSGALAAQKSRGRTLPPVPGAPMDEKENRPAREGREDESDRGCRRRP